MPYPRALHKSKTHKYANRQITNQPHTQKPQSAAHFTHFTHSPTQPSIPPIAALSSRTPNNEKIL